MVALLVVFTFIAAILIDALVRRGKRIEEGVELPSFAGAGVAPAPATVIPNVLVVDDEKTVCNSCKKILTREGYNVEVAMSGEEALSKVKGNEFDVLVKINKFGFRGEDFGIEKEKSTLRIFMVGDSFTYGVGAENNQTIPYLTEQRLREEGLRVEVVNAGKGHASTISHYLKLRDIYLKFKPDVVFLLFDFSDLEDDWRLEKHLVCDKDGKMLYLDPSVVDGKRDSYRLEKRNIRKVPKRC